MLLASIGGIICLWQGFQHQTPGPKKSNLIDMGATFRIPLVHWDPDPFLDLMMVVMKKIKTGLDVKQFAVGKDTAIAFMPAEQKAMYTQALEAA